MKLFTLEKIPYALTAILAIIAVQFNYIVEATFKIPVVEYQFSHMVADTASHYKYKYKVTMLLSNISIDKSINDLKLELKHGNLSKARLTEPNMDAVPPAERVRNDPTYDEERMLFYTIHSLQPGQSYKLTFITDSVATYPNVNFTNSKSMKLLQSSFYTCLLKHQLRINLALMLLFIMGAGIYIFKLAKLKTN